MRLDGAPHARARSEDERVNVQARYAVALHLHANKKIGTAWFAIAVVGVVAALVLQNFWFIAGAIALGAVTYFWIMQSCVRFITQQTGMPPDVQALFSRKYKTDPEFARDVDKLASGAEKFP